MLVPSYRDKEKVTRFLCKWTLRNKRIREERKKEKEKDMFK